MALIAQTAVQDLIKFLTLYLYKPSWTVLSRYIWHTIVSKSSRLDYDTFLTKTVLKIQNGKDRRGIDRRNELSLRKKNDRPADMWYFSVSSRDVAGSWCCPRIAQFLWFMGVPGKYDLFYKKIGLVVVGKLVMVTSYDLYLAVWSVFMISL